MAQQLGQVAVGSIVKLNENGSPVNYIVVHQGKPSSSYDSSCDGTWLLRQDIAENRAWDSGNSNVLESSDIHSYLNNTWINRYDTDIRNGIKQVKIPYRQNGGSGGTDRNGANGLSCKIFLLSGYEVGFTTSVNKYFPVDGAKLSYFLSGNDSAAQQKRVANLNGNATLWWLRSQHASSTSDVWYVYSSGNFSSWNASSSYGVRPALILPSTLFVTDDGLVSVTVPPPNALTVPIQAMQGNQLSVSWSAVDGADGYILERKANTDADWTQVYSGANTSFDETVGTWTSVQYRVKAGVDGTYGEYTTSAVISVVSASALVISGSDGDLGTLLDDVSYVVASDGTNALNVTEVINGVTTRSYTAVNGGTNVIPVVDLPTGYGTITITATTQDTGGAVTVTREWTYTKTAITFPDEGSVGQLTKEGENVWPITLAEAVKTPGIWGGNLGLALQTLAKAVLYDPETGGFEGIGGADAAIPVPRIETGSYVGTGTKGASNPTVLTFSGTPKAVFCMKSDSSYLTDPTDGFVWAGQPGGTGNNNYPVFSQEDNSLSLYSNGSADWQCNTSNVTYYYVALIVGGESA